MANLLVVDADEGSLDATFAALERGGHDVERARDGRSALLKLRELRPALVVASVEVPDLDGFTFARRVRNGGDWTPIVLLSASGSLQELVTGLGAGADACIARPLEPGVLLAHVEALLRRAMFASGPGLMGDVLRRGGLLLDPARMEASYLGCPLDLTVTELRLLELLARNPGTVYSRARVLRELRGEATVVAQRLVDTYVRRLRRALEAVEPGFRWIETIIGAGYRWREADHFLSVATPPSCGSTGGL